MAHHSDQYDRFLDSVDLDTDIEDLELDRRQLVLLGRQGRYMRDAFRGMRLDSVELHKELASVRRLIRREGERIMADLTGINAALADLSAQITQLADQVAALSAGQVTQAELDDIASRLSAAAASVDAIVEPDAGEEPPVEPEPPV